jgi:hypothetical protein
MFRLTYALPTPDMRHRIIDPALYAERQAVAGRRNLVDRRVESVAGPAHDVQDRAEYLALKAVRRIDLEGVRGEEITALGARRQLAFEDEAALAPHPLGVELQTAPRLGIDHRADIGRDRQGIADREFPHRPRQHRDQALGDIRRTYSRRNAEQRCPARWACASASSTCAGPDSATVHRS